MKTVLTIIACAGIVVALRAAAWAASVDAQIVYMRARDANGAVMLLPVFDPRGHRMRYEVMVDETDTPVRVRDVESRGGAQRFFVIDSDPNGNVYFRLRVLASDGRIVFDPVPKPPGLRVWPLAGEKE